MRCLAIQIPKPKIDEVQADPADLDVILTGGLVMTAKLRDLILLRRTIRTDQRFKLVYARNAPFRLYLVTEDEYALLKKLKEGENEK